MPILGNTNTISASRRGLPYPATLNPVLYYHDKKSNIKENSTYPFYAENISSISGNSYIYADNNYKMPLIANNSICGDGEDDSLLVNVVNLYDEFTIVFYGHILTTAGFLFGDFNASTGNEGWGVKINNGNLFFSYSYEGSFENKLLGTIETGKTDSILVIVRINGTSLKLEYDGIEYEYTLNGEINQASSSTRLFSANNSDGDPSGESTVNLSEFIIYDYRLNDNLMDNIKNYFNNKDTDPIYIKSSIFQNDSINYQFSNLHIDAQKNGKAIATAGDYLYFSDDGGETFVQKSKFEHIWEELNMSWIFDNGNIVFATHQKIYKSTDNLDSYSEITVKDTEGNTISLDEGGGPKFRIFNPPNPAYRNDREEIVFGNYTNQGTYSAVNIYHLLDTCNEIKLIYQFGQNPNFGGYGDASENHYTKHVHHVAYNSNDDFWWVQTGDDEVTIDTTTYSECHWIKITESAGSYTITFEYSGNTNSWYKTTGFYFDTDNNAIFAQDTTDSTKSGIWKVPYSEINNTGSYVQLLDVDHVLYGFRMNSNEIVASFTTSVFVSNNGGDTFSTINNIIPDNTETSHNRLYRIWDKNDKGYYKMEPVFDSFDVNKHKVLYVRIK